jgi:thiamine-monophosphate kinase
MSPEFNLIQQYFTRPARYTDLSVGDDAALLHIKRGHQLAVSTDMLVAETHFFADAEPYNIGWKALAVNVSDMAAMGALPKWATLALALPEINQAWLSEFSRGFFACADAFEVDLIGGDTTRGSLNICVTIMGLCEKNHALKRSGAQADDDIWVSGFLGSAALGLAHLQKKLVLEENTLEAALKALHTPEPRVALGLALKNIAHSCIDISDGLLADLGHILKASQLDAHLNYAAMPVLPALQARLQEAALQQAVLAGGDDYELCFTAPKHQRDAIARLSQQLSLPLTLIGKTKVRENITTSAARVFYHDNEILLNAKGFDHFA